MINKPINKPIVLPNGPASETKDVLVKTKEPHPIAVPTDKANAPKTEMALMLDLFSINNFII